MSDGYIRVTNWNRFQHYRNRKPPWVKFYVELLHPANRLNDLPVTTRFLFDRLLLLAAEYENAIPSDPELIAKLLRMRSQDVRVGLSQLSKGKWISQTSTKRRSVSDAKRSRTGSEAVAKLARDGSEHDSEDTDDRSSGKRGSQNGHHTSASKRASTKLATETETETYMGNEGKGFKCPLCTVRYRTEKRTIEHLENVHDIIVTSLADYRTTAA